jgi:FkbM family methyltransferase
MTPKNEPAAIVPLPGFKSARQTIQTIVPGQKPIDLVSFYPEFINYYSNCEPQTKKWFVEHIQKDWTILDCGANIGYFSILFSRCAHQGRVYAFEPTTTHDMLLENLAYNRITNVTALQLALGKKTGRQTDAIFRIWGKDPEKQEYPFSTVDDFVITNNIQRVDCIKIDVDSFDFEVLQGARQTLQKHDPYIMVELNHALAKRGQSNAEALEWLASLGYTAAEVLDYDNFLLKKSRQEHILNTAQRAIVLVYETNEQQQPENIVSAAPSTKSAAQHSTVKSAGNEIAKVNVCDLHSALNFNRAIEYPLSSQNKPFSRWKMEIDDSPIFRYIYRNFKPMRHLEFGTWQGTGTCYCIEESDATVWTINTPFGETLPTGEIAYAHPPQELIDLQNWAKKTGLPEQKSYRTDCIGFIGRHYLDKGYGARVCQIYCDSREWDISNYPDGFFDTVLIDGGHQEDIVISDTMKAMELVRSGGIIMWHDFCPEALDLFEACRGVDQAVKKLRNSLISQMKTLFWIYPSFILCGIKK